VEEKDCHFCDDEGHRPGDEWTTGNNNCTSCVCQLSGKSGKAFSNCTSPECPKKPVCPAGETLAEVSGTETDCCPRYDCKPIKFVSTPAPPTNTSIDQPVSCPDVVEPFCDNNEGQVMEVMYQGHCRTPHCVCIPESCPKPEPLRELRDGESIRKSDKTCCKKEVIHCEKTACAAPPDCPEGFYLETDRDTSDHCCPKQYCKQPPDTCLVRLDVAIDIRAITAESTEGFVLKQAGEVWTDGYCDNCTCREVPDGEPRYQPVCVQEVCAPPPTADALDYRHEEDEDSDACCPPWKRVACKHAGKEYGPGETWADPEDACITWECARDTAHVIIKVPSREKCVEDCPKGHTYIPAGPDSGAACCGRCEKTACVYGGEVRPEGDFWKSADGCTELMCERDFFDGRLGVLSSKVLCRDVSDCPKANLYTDETGCCQRCNRTDNCHVIVIPPEETVGMFKAGDCVNEQSLENIISCQGACDSAGFFDTESGTIQSGCKCCSVTLTRQLDLQLSCDRLDAYGEKVTEYHTFSVPDTCACSKCSSSSTELGDHANDIWQQMTGEQWVQQTDAEPFSPVDPWGDTSREGGAEFFDTAGGGGGRGARIPDQEFIDLFQPGEEGGIGQGAIH